MTLGLSRLAGLLRPQEGSSQVSHESEPRPQRCRISSPADHLPGPPLPQTSMSAKCPQMRHPPATTTATTTWAASTAPAVQATFSTRTNAPAQVSYSCQGHPVPGPAPILPRVIAVLPWGLDRPRALLLGGISPLFVLLYPLTIHPTTFSKSSPPPSMPALRPFPSGPFVD